MPAFPLPNGAIVPIMSGTNELLVLSNNTVLETGHGWDPAKPAVIGHQRPRQQAPSSGYQMVFRGGSSFPPAKRPVYGSPFSSPAQQQSPFQYGGIRGYTSMAAAEQKPETSVDSSGEMSPEIQQMIEKALKFAQSLDF